MNRNARIELVITLGGGEQYVVPLELSPQLQHALSEPMELSEKPLSMLIEAFRPVSDPIEFAMIVPRYEVTRRRKFEMREEHAKHIADQITQELVRFFGRRDTTDGYSHEQNERFERFRRAER